MKRPYRVENLTSTSNKFSISILHNGQTVTLLSSTGAKRFLEENFSEFLYLAKYDPEKTKSENITATREHFADIFEMWKNDNARNFEFLYSALYDEYNPLENYDRKEDGTITDEHHKGNKVATASKETTTPNLTTETTNRTKVKSSDFVYGFDSATASPTGYSESEPTAGTDKIEQTGNTETTREAQDNYTTVTDISENVFDNDKRTFSDYHIHGNIGVTKATDLISAELSLRTESLVRKLLYSFANQYLFYSDCLEVVE